MPVNFASATQYFYGFYITFDAPTTGYTTGSELFISVNFSS